MRIISVFLLGGLLISGCHRVVTPTYPDLDAYTKQTKANPEFLAAWQDLNGASKYCRDIHNSYEARAKNAEEAKLAIGTAGGVLGFTGAMLVAAGTGGFAGGIASGLAGVSSTVLGTAEKGPLGVAAFTEQKVSIAKMIQDASSEASKLPASDHAKVFAIAQSLRNSCFAAEAVTAAE